MVDATPSGARESFAGDDFHVLWAVRRVLALLDPTSGLERVVMEDLTPLPLEGVDQNLLLAADLTEFYGGSDLGSADRVVVSQLKYSHRHPERAWTAARLAARGSRGQKGVVARLADLYAGVAKTGSREDVIGRLEIRLVSNMPCGPTLATALAAARCWLADHPNRAGRAALLAALNASDREQIERLSAASGLRSFAFADFLRVLDLSHTGASGRSDQELRITRALADHVMTDLRYASLAVADLVRQRGGPDQVGRPIEAVDVLAALDVHSRFDLLPSPPRFAPPVHRVRSPDAAQIAQALINDPSRKVLAHGEAGVGKTTAILGLEKELPAGSVVLTYDCFGDGDYETPGAGRHDPQRFALQLCNELATRCRLPLLVRPSRSVHDLWRELDRRIRAVAQLLNGEGARLVIVVDAADNAAWAGRRFGEDTFLRRLWAQPIPPGAGLVVTCRTGRRDTVERPEGVRQVPLRGFDEAASAEYLRARFPQATDEEARAFHKNSSHNPRVQFYVLFQNRADAATSVAEAVKQADLTPNDLFENLLAAAVEQAPDAAAARERMAELVCLTKPLTTGRFRAVSGMAANRVRSLCESLVPGVVIEDDVLAFRDEDFANFLRAKVGESDERRAHSRLADLFLGQANDAYAATVVADHLHNAGRDDDLVKLALTGTPETIVDGLARQQTYRRRLALALRRAADVADRAAACRLVVLAAEAARTDHAVTTILRRRPDLGMRYSDPEAVMRVYESVEQPEWRGPIHMRLAAYYARIGNQEAARAEGNAARAWLVRRQESDDSWDIEADDVGAYAEAWFHLHGVVAAEEQIRAWRPPEFAIASAVALVRRLAPIVPGADLGALIATRDLPAVVRARMLAAAFQNGATPAVVSVSAVVSALQAEKLELQADDGSWAATIAELAAYAGLGKRRVLALTNALQLPVPRRAPDRFGGLDRFRDLLRLAALRAALKGRKVELEELMPASVTDPSDDPRARRDIESERRAMHEHVGRHLDVFMSRARMMVARPPVAELRAEWEKHLARDLSERTRYGREPDLGYGTWLRAFVDAVLACNGADAKLVALACDRAEELVGDGAYACWLAAARRLMQDARYRDLGLLLVERAAKAIESAEWPASQRADALLDACGVADQVDDEHAADLHSRAIRAAEGMDDEAIGRLELHAQIAEGVIGAADADKLAWRTMQVLVNHRKRVSDADQLPWRTTLKAVARLHPPTALALVARLEDDCLMFLNASVPTVTDPLVDAGFLTPVQALALLPLVEEFTSTTQEAVQLLERMPPDPARAAALASLSLRIRRDLLPDVRPAAARALIDWAEKHDLEDAEAVSALPPYCLPPKADDGKAAGSREWRSGTSDWDRRQQQADAVLARAELAAPSDVTADLAELADLYGAERIPRYLANVAERLVPSQRGAFVSLLGAIGIDHPVARFHTDDVFDALADASREWGGSPALRTQLAESVTQLLETHVESLMRRAELTTNVVAQVLQLPVLDDPASLILHVVGSSLERVDPPALFAVASQLALALDHEERAAFLRWSLDAMETEAAVVPALPSDSTDVLASMLWSLFGAPDKATRWRTAHVARSLITTGDEGLAGALLELSARHDAGAFGSVNSPFHWLAAQTWTVMTIARAAGDVPARLAALAPRLAAMARDVAWPHVGVREFARRAALRIGEARSDALKAETIQELRFANMPRACRRDRTDWFHRTGSGTRDYDTERFHFSMDTLPYVYGPFGERFGLDVDQVAERAERWIVDRLGLSSDRHRDPRLEQLDYSHSYSNHGSSPRGETWHQMLEEHALQLVAGELCDEGVLIEGERGDEPADPWASWLGKWTDALEYAWLADERSPVPPNPTLLLRDLDRRDWPPLTDAELLRAIAADEPDELIVSAEVSFSSGLGWGSTSVTSALVDPRTASALARALRAADNPYLFALPMESPQWASNQGDIDDGEFRLFGWLVEASGPDGLEHHDPLRRIRPSVTRLGDRFLDIAQATVERGGRVIRGPEGLAVAWQRTWSDIVTVGTGREESSGTDGHEVRVRRDDLVKFLRAADAVLIIKAHATRRMSKTDHVTEDEETHEQQVHGVYVFGPGTGLVG